MRNLIFLGARQIALQAIRVLARPENREALRLAVLVSDAETNALVRQEFSQLVPCFVPNDKRRTTEIISSIKEERADLLISVQHNWILSKEVLAAVGGQAFNLHNARLPHYQGYNSVSHAILNGDESFYSTIHWMEAEVDTGDIAFEKITPINSNDTALSLHHRTIASALVVFERLVEALRTGASIPRHVPPKHAAKFYGKNSLKDIADVTAMRNPVELDRFARALFYPPFNMAYQMVDGRRTYLVPELGIIDLCKIGFPVDDERLN